MSDITTKALSTVISNPKNIKIFKKYIDVYRILGDKEYKRVLYQVIGDIAKNKSNLPATLATLKKQTVGWKHPMFDDMKRKIEEHDDYLAKPFDVAEGVVECKKCGSRRTFSVQKQCRSSDEPMTTFSRCVECSATWTYDG